MKKAALIFAIIFGISIWGFAQETKINGDTDAFILDFYKAINLYYFKYYPIDKKFQQITLDDVEKWESFYKDSGVLLRIKSYLEMKNNNLYNRKKDIVLITLDSLKQINRLPKNDYIYWKLIDSLIIIYNDAIRLTDTINFPFTKEMQSLTIDYLKQIHYNPDDYFLIKSDGPIFDNNNYIIYLQKKRVLIKSYDIETGRSETNLGGHVYGDIITIGYNNDFTNIIGHIVNIEE